MTPRPRSRFSSASTSARTGVRIVEGGKRRRFKPAATCKLLQHPMVGQILATLEVGAEELIDHRPVCALALGDLHQPMGFTGIGHALQVREVEAYAQVTSGLREGVLRQVHAYAVGQPGRQMLAPGSRGGRQFTLDAQAMPA